MSVPVLLADVGSTFLALDLGGTNLRVCEVKLNSDNKFEMKQQKYKVSDELKEGQAKTLFGEWTTHQRLSASYDLFVMSGCCYVLLGPS